jgi:hypothetical protein
MSLKNARVTNRAAQMLFHPFDEGEAPAALLPEGATLAPIIERLVKV